MDRVYASVKGEDHSSVEQLGVPMQLKPKARKKPIYLSDEDKYIVGEYLFEYNSVKNSDNEKGYEFRVKLSTLAEEVTNDLCEVRPAHLQQCVDFYLLVNKLAKRPIVFPKNEDTTELQAKITTLEKENEEIVKRVNELVKSSEYNRTIVDNLKERMYEIRKLAQ